MSLKSEHKKLIVEEYGSSKKDTGNIEVQIALLTKEIELLTQHLQINRKDFISKRGLFMKVAHRKALLNYLKKNDFERARSIQTKLNLRSL
jgi:small subunit ribosomal protein S15